MTPLTPSSHGSCDPSRERLRGPPRTRPSQTAFLTGVLPRPPGLPALTAHHPGPSARLHADARPVTAKLAYDESLSDCSPGVLLLHEVLRACLRRGVRTIDFLRDVAEWKLRWTQEALRHEWLYIFRDTRRGRALQRAKFRWIPEARRMLGALRSCWSSPA